MIYYGLSREVKEFALRQLGADLVGIASVDRFVGAPPGHRPEELLLGAKSVIVLAKRFLDSTFLSTNPRIYVQRYWQLCHLFQDAGYEMCRFLEDQGHFAINFPSTAPQDSGPIGKMLFADFSHRHAAVLSGMGQIGRNQLLITPQYGPRVWLMSVITTARLDADPLLGGNICPGEKCNLCVLNCPEGALSPKGRDPKKCIRAYGKFGLAGFLKHLRNIIEERELEKRKELIFGPTTWTTWMVLQFGTGPSMCNACMASCPIGWKTDEIPRFSVSAEVPTAAVKQFVRADESSGK